MTVRAVVCYLRRGDRVLLQRKAAGRWGEGKWNAPGGKCLPGEEPEAAAIREVREETGLAVGDLDHRGILHFTFGELERPDWIVHVFSASTFSGVPMAGEEGELRWHPVDALPYEAMWPDDRVWLPEFLSGHRFVGHFRFDAQAERLLDYRLERLPPATSGDRFGVLCGIHVSRGGVPKRPIPEAEVTPEGIRGDGHDDPSHGGPERALCLFSLEVIERLAGEGHPIAPGTTGENLTIAGLRWGLVQPGVRLRIGEIRVEITRYTTPCKTIRSSFRDGDFHRIHPARHPGQSRVYARVVRPGRVRRGDPVEILPAP